MDRAFSHWEAWSKRGSLVGLSDPGVYVLAITQADISATAFTWCPAIIYVGMTNSKGGLKSHLLQFDNTIKGKDGHGGAYRVRFNHPVYATLTSELYVSVSSWKCEVRSNSPSDLRVMGEVEQFEYECFACFATAFGKLPEFNDKKRSPKK